MSWLADLAGKAEDLLVNFDEKTGAALRHQNVGTKQKKQDRYGLSTPEPRKTRPIPHTLKNLTKKVTPTPSPSRGYKDNPVVKVPKQRPLMPKKTNNNCPRTLVGDLKEEMMGTYGYKPRRFSLPTDLEKLDANDYIQRMENVEVENAMLKNELNVTNREIKELIDRLHRTEEGERLVDTSSKELALTNTKLENSELNNRKVNVDKDSLQSQIEQLQSQLTNITTGELSKFKEQRRELQSEISVLRERNKDLEELVKLLNEQAKEQGNIHNRTETDLRHAQSTINMLQNEVEKSSKECKRLEKEWESYKHRVKSMLSAKDKEVKTLQQGLSLTEDTKILVEQIEHLKEEREVLSEAVNRVRGECGDMKQYMETLENKHNATERVVVALRDALKDERAARTRAEASCNSMAKELKVIQIETAQTIANLRSAMQEKEFSRLHSSNMTSSVQSSETSAINVADYDVSHHSDESQKINYLTQKLVERQGKIDTLMADNNMLKIQLEKLEQSRHKTEVHSGRCNSHSVLQVSNEPHHRTHGSQCGSEKVTRFVGKIFRSRPIFRVFLFFYMLCLHFWVLTVLLTNAPDSYGHKPYHYGPRS